MSDRAIFNYVNIYHITAVCETPLHIGSAEGDAGEILIHPVTREAFIQASGLAGSFREYADDLFGADICGKWFGSGNTEAENRTETGQEDCRSRIVFTDGIFEKNNFNLELRTRVRLDPVSGTTASAEVSGTGATSGQLLETEYISRGSQVSFDIYEYYKEPGEKRILPVCLAAMDRGNILIGGQLSNGCGQLKFTGLSRLSCDMTTGAGRKAWMNPEGAEWEDILPEIRGLDIPSANAWDLYMDVTFDHSVLVKGDAVDEDLIEQYTGQQFGSDNRAPDVMQLLDGNRNFVIPGSSLKGVFRSRMEMIASYKKLEKELMDLTFENRSKVFFYDALLENRMNLVVRNRIDKFTGGTRNTGLFKEAVNGGDTTFHIRLSKPASASGAESGWNESTSEQILALLLLTMRDCAIGAVNVGSGSGVGRGFMTVHRITVKDNGNTLAAVYPEENRVEDQNGLIAKCLRSIQQSEKH
ncbi:MAG: RAMP superfamily CRISPR-associated protein [Lachnospiraceae bacterium]|nr:RAMP superfamily CRISPR-associated protein [Lachnospiraceae bacterium]MDY4968989.1 RAMP superfamily CRISPR-associated protein [Lachnospiraceae bacterium]